MSWDESLFHRQLTTRRFGREFVWMPELDSTNRWLFEHAAEFTMSGGVAATDHQTAGRGRYDRVWHDVPGSSLLFSVLLRYKTCSESAGFLAFLPAISLAGTLIAHCGDKCHISLKWPNDVLLNKRKAAGILGQTIVQGEDSLSVVGIGLNIAMRRRELPEEIRERATSVLDEAGKSLARESVLAEFLSRLENLYDRFMAHDWAGLRFQWERYAPERGTPMTRREGTEVFSGWYEGVGDGGQLLLRDETGIIREFWSGDIEQ
ncbi:biotin--[acetyl-CoA-carboxylase] ligase [candidate division KSB1 bacterium]|nr:MAG: biotin--[acetyl-CoA-carboxylase] ligase [candidate division KSB1 bacterium]